MNSKKKIASYRHRVFALILTGLGEGGFVLDVPLFSGYWDSCGFPISILFLGNSTFGYCLRLSDPSGFALLAPVT